MIAQTATIESLVDDCAYQSLKRLVIAAKW